MRPSRYSRCRSTHTPRASSAQPPANLVMLPSTPSARVAQLSLSLSRSVSLSLSLCVCVCVCVCVRVYVCVCRSVALAPPVGAEPLRPNNALQTSTAAELGTNGWSQPSSQCQPDSNRE